MTTSEKQAALNALTLAIHCKLEGAKESLEDLAGQFGAEITTVEHCTEIMKIFDLPRLHKFLSSKE